MYSLLII